MDTFETSPFGNIHGMPLAVCLGEEKSFVGVSKTFLNPNNLLLLGTRSVDVGEQILLDRLRVTKLSSEYLWNHNIEDIVYIAHDFISRNGITNIHISFDIDVLDPRLAPGTGVPELNGITDSKALNILNEIFASKMVRSMDIVEFNPKLDLEKRLGKYVRM